MFVRFISSACYYVYIYYNFCKFFQSIVKTKQKNNNTLTLFVVSLSFLFESI